MALISEDTIQQVTMANDIVDVVSSYFPLKRAGASWRALCPFHKEKSPSFNVNPTRQTFHCFGCGTGGTVIRFVMNYEGVDFPTAVRRLAQRAGIPLVESQTDPTIYGERARLLALHSQAARWFHQNLLKEPDAASARQYLKSRGLSKDIAINWQIGYAPKSWNAFSEWALSQGFSTQELVRSGLVSQRERSADFYDRFRDRLMFPIRNDFGEAIAFSGRLLAKDSPEGGKYVNSPETPLFSKGRILFGLDKTKRALIEAGEALVCEGQIDLISCFEADIRNVVAPQGTAFTADQARLLKRYVEAVLLCFDADSAGQQAIERSLPALLSCELSVKIVQLPAGEDPDSLIQSQGPEALRHLISQAVNYFDFAIDRASVEGTLESAMGRTNLARKLAGFIRLIETLALREMLSINVSSRLGISLEAFGQLMARSDSPVFQERLENSSSSALFSPALGEGPELLSRLALASREVRDWLSKQISPSPQQLLPRASLLHKILSSEVSLEDTISFGKFLESLDLRETNTVLSWNMHKIPEAPLTVAMDCWRGILRNHLKAKQELVKAKLRNVQSSSDEYFTIQKEFLDLHKRLQDNLRPFSAQKSA